MSLISNIHLGSTAIILCTTFFIGNVQSFNWTLGSSTPFSEISEQKHYIRSGQQRNPALNYLQDVPLHACIALYTNLARLILQFYVWYTMSIYVDKNMVMIYILQLLPTCKYLQTACTWIYSNFHGRGAVAFIELWSRNFENGNHTHAHRVLSTTKEYSLL